MRDPEDPFEKLRELAIDAWCGEEPHDVEEHNAWLAATKEFEEIWMDRETVISVMWILEKLRWSLKANMEAPCAMGRTPALQLFDALNRFLGRVNGEATEDDDDEPPASRYEGERLDPILGRIRDTTPTGMTATPRRKEGREEE